MRVAAIEISNYRNIKHAIAENLPNLVLLWGANGSGKSTILEAVLLAKEAATEGSQVFLNERNVVAADSESAKVILTLEFSPTDIAFARSKLNFECPSNERIEVIFERGKKRPICSCSLSVKRLLATFTLEAGAPGYFDYFPASRRIQEQRITNVNLSISRDQAKNTLTNSDQKFSLTKHFLSLIKIADLRDFQSRTIQGLPTTDGPIEAVRQIFKRFLSPMQFIDVDLGSDPVKFVVRTASGEVDIDDLSSGEKEVLHTALRFTHMKPSGAVVLFDEPDAHLHSNLAKAFCRYLEEVSEDNQIWVATHSVDMMMASPLNSLYLVTKSIETTVTSQVNRLITDSDRYRALIDVTGGAGLVAVNRKVVFIEGIEASADLDIFEKFFPSSEWNVSFVPSGPSYSVKAVAEKVTDLLAIPFSFHEYYCVIDGDSAPSGEPPAADSRLFRLPVYHIENYLLDPANILATTRKLLRSRCSFESISDIKDRIFDILRSPAHVSALARSRLDNHVRALSRDIGSAILHQRPLPTIPTYRGIEDGVRSAIEDSIQNDTWQKVCKGRDVLQRFAGQINVRYSILRNLLIDSLTVVPGDLLQIIEAIGARKVMDNLNPQNPFSTRTAQIGEQLSDPTGFLSIPPDLRQPHHAPEDGTFQFQDGRVTLAGNQVHVVLNVPDATREQLIAQGVIELLSSNDGPTMWNILVLANQQTDPHYAARSAEFCQHLGVTCSS